MFRYRIILFFLLFSLTAFIICQLGIYFYIYPAEISFSELGARARQALLSLIGREEQKLISINLSNKVLATFEDGQLVKRYKITAAGHPRISPTPTGDFEILSKIKNAFSNLSHVWMPWSMRFYKQYFMHEIPYYPSGRRLTYAYSAGCIRLPIGTAQEVYEWATVGTKVHIHSAKLVKTTDNDKVYYLTEKGLKRYIPNLDVFFSYSNKWENIVIIRPFELEAYPDVVLVHLDKDSKVYKLENGFKRWIRTPEVFNRLGYNWQEIAPVNQVEFNIWPTGETIE